MYRHHKSFFGNLYIYIPIQQSTQPGTDNPVILFSYHSKQEQPGHSSDPATPLNTVKPNTPRYHSQLHHTLPVWELPYIPTYLPTKPTMLLPLLLTLPSLGASMPALTVASASAAAMPAILIPPTSATKQNVQPIAPFNVTGFAASAVILSHRVLYVWSPPFPLLSPPTPPSLPPSLVPALIPMLNL